MVVLFFTFGVNNYINFYVMFEISLIPTLTLIIGWGYQPERLQAGVYLLMYTMCGSLPLLICIFYYGHKVGSIFMFFKGAELNLNPEIVGMFWLGIVMAFIIKMPIYLTHL